MSHSIVPSRLTSLDLASPDLTSPDLSLAEGPECSLSAAERRALWKRFYQALVAKVGRRKARRVVRRGVTQGSPRAIPVCLDRVPLPDWRFLTVFEAEAAHMPDSFEPAPVLQSTQARPGSAEKIAVLRDRAERGVDLWHPEDEDGDEEGRKDRGRKGRGARDEGQAVRLAAALVIGLLLSSTSSADVTLPLVEERVDAIALVHTLESDSVRVVFVRNGRILAERWLTDEMQWHSLADDPGGFALLWTDYGVAERVVRFRAMFVLVFERDPLADDGGPWWGMNRRMVDLKAPP